MRYGGYRGGGYGGGSRGGFGKLGGGYGGYKGYGGSRPRQTGRPARVPRHRRRIMPLPIFMPFGRRRRWGGRGGCGCGAIIFIILIVGLLMWLFS